MATAREMNLVNKDLLVEELGLKQFGNSNVFYNEDFFCPFSVCATLRKRL